MKHLKLLTAAFAFSLFLLTGCEKDTADSVSPTSVNKSAKHAAETKENLVGPIDLDLRLLEQQPVLLLKTHPEYRDMVLRALGAVEETPCDNNTAMNQWLNQELDDWFDEEGNLLPEIADALSYVILDLPTYDALYFVNSSEGQYYGVNGEYTKVITKTFKDLQRFFNIPSDDIVLAAMHGDMLLDRDRIIRTYVNVYGLPPTLAAAFADIVVDYANEIPQFRDGDHPIFTFNAFAFSGWNYIPKKIIMGDGILAAFEGIGYGDVAPQAILAHEFAHQVQYHLDLFVEDPDNVPEATRRTELMADAYAAYYLSHARGATMQWKRVEQFLEVFFNLGDCGFESDGHHGTPTQRMAAAEWGYNLANNAQKQGHIISVEKFAELFEAQLPMLVLQ
jgi:hypothetical protein